MADQVTISKSTGAVTHDGAGAVDLYRARVVRTGLRACKNGLRLNRAYTPKNLMALAAQLTGKQFKARDYDGAIAAMDVYIGGVEQTVPVAVVA